MPITARELGISQVQDPVDLRMEADRYVPVASVRRAWADRSSIRVA